MSTTTIRLDGPLRSRLDAAAQRAGKTSNAPIVDAIAETVDGTEHDKEFDHVADERWPKILTTGKTIDWDAARDWLEARSRGERPRKPVARKHRL